MRNHKVYRKVQTGPRMTTEYQAKFHAPRNYVATSTSKQKDPHHPQTESTANITTVRSVYVSTQWIKKPPKAPHSDTRGTHTPLNENFTTIYQNDFKAWKPDQRKSFRPHHSLSVDQGLSSTEDNKNTAIVDAKSTKQKKEKKPFEGVTTYTSDFVPHPVQPRPNRVKNAHQSSTELLKESYKPTVTSATKQHHNDANDFFQQFQVWSLKTKLHGYPKDSMFQSKTHEGHLEPKNQRTKSVLSTQTKKDLPQTIVTQEFCRAWNGPKSFTSAHQTSDWPIKTTFSKYNPKPAETRPHSKVGDSTPFKSTAQRYQLPAKSRGLPAFECSTNMFWSGSLNGGMSWFLEEVQAS